MSTRPFAHFSLILAAVLTSAGWVRSQPNTTNAEKLRTVSINDSRAFKGYTLIAPLTSKATYLIDMDGRVVHTWASNSAPALVTYLLDNGNLLRPGSGSGSAGDIAARVQEFDWDGGLLWEYAVTGQNQHQHHDVVRMPNGNILMIVADRKNAGEAILAGRRPELVQDVLNVDGIIEVKQTGPTSGEVVWEWHAWDHLVQEHDKTKRNYDKVSSRPERIDINYVTGAFGLGGKPFSNDELEKLKGLGYLGGPSARNLPASPAADWTHFNCLDYNAELDQIMITVPGFSEIWIIDHSTTKAQAATSQGGKYGKGGDLIYRWGNPQAYRSGTNADQRLFQQHNGHWIPRGLPGAGNVLIFSNGRQRPDGAYSSVEEVVLPLNKDGGYDRKPGLPFGPNKAEWSYSAAKKPEFFAPFVSGAQRLANGNTLICSGTSGTVFEVTREKEIVWKFTNLSKGAANEFQADGLFRAYRFAADHPALQGRELVPGKRINEL